MAAILLTADNIDFVKSAFREALPHVKSSHLTEALAFGAGYRTHAALLAAIKAASPMRPVLARVDASRIAMRLVALGYLNPSAACTDGIIRSPSLPERIWIEFRNRDLAANNHWFNECRERDIPNIFIERRRKYVELSWDCISIDPSSEAHVRDERGSALLRIMFKTYQGIARRIPGKSLFFGSSFTGSVDRLLPELAYDMADEFFAMLYEPMCAQEIAA